MPLTKNTEPLILNVDDSDAARYAKSRVLIRAGFNVIEAASGGEALQRARSERPTLMLLDVKLPDINGMEVCRMLKADPETQSILILQTSASFIGIADKIRALDGGADNYLVEPIEPDELIANVKALLRLGKVERELREVDRRKDEFLAVLAHELRNPLAPIKNAAELLLRKDPDAPQWQMDARTTIRRHVNHLVRLVDDLLDVSRISHAKIAIKREPVAVSTFVRTAVEANLVLLENARQELKISLPEQELWIDGDEARLAQIVGNLLHNASKFTHAGGRVELSAFADGDQVVLRISDTGIGIAANRLEYIFGMFAQAEHAEDKGREGLGIGLSLVKTLVELHGGTVTACSAGSGKGSTFEVRLPGYRETLATGPQAPAAESSPAAVTGKKILVVDDVADGADTLSELLQMMGHEVRTAYSGKQAIEAAREFIPDAVFLDIGLQDMSGYEVAATLRGMEHVRHSYLIALTGFGQEQDRLQAFAAGFDEHIVKPVDFEVISNLTFEH